MAPESQVEADLSGFVGHGQEFELLFKYWEAMGGIYLKEQLESSIQMPFASIVDSVVMRWEKK